MSRHGSSFWVRWRVQIGYPVAAVCLLLARPTWRSILAGSAVAALGLVIRGAAAGHIRKGQALATDGPYARTRNPLYFGSAFLAVGFGIATHSWIALVLLAAFFGVSYYSVMRREEADLRVLYGQDFDDYSRRVPLFWPRLTAAKGSAGGESEFSWAQYMRNHEYRAGIGVALLMIAFAGLALWRR